MCGATAKGGLLVYICEFQVAGIDLNARNHALVPVVDFACCEDQRARRVSPQEGRIVDMIFLVGKFKRHTLGVEPSGRQPWPITGSLREERKLSIKGSDENWKSGAHFIPG
jgi:hypothetical protein